MASTRCFTQIALRLTAGNILRGIEAGKVLPDDFLRRVALDFLCPWVPRHHVAVRVEHVDRVFFHAIHQNVELLGCLMQC